MGDANADTTPLPNASENEQPKSNRRRSKENDVSRLSRSGNSLYELLDIPKTSTAVDIKKKYRRLALKYHPDKNPDNAEAEEMFKKINQANSILSDEKKRQLYDEYGSFGLYIAEQVGDDLVGSVMFFQSKWFKAVFGVCCLITGCYCCCCFLCCCFCCCGKCKPKMEDEEDLDMPDVDDLEGEADVEDEEKGPVTSQPEASNGSIPAFATPMPAPAASSSATSPHSPSSPIPMPGPGHTEKSPLKNSTSDQAPPSYDSVFPNTNQKGENV